MKLKKILSLTALSLSALILVNQSFANVVSHGPTVTYINNINIQNPTIMSNLQLNIHYNVQYDNGSHINIGSQKLPLGATVIDWSSMQDFLANSISFIGFSMDDHYNQVYFLQDPNGSCNIVSELNKAGKKNVVITAKESDSADYFLECAVSQ